MYEHCFHTVYCIYYLPELQLCPPCYECNYRSSKVKKNPNPEDLIDYAVENETHVSVFTSTFRDILDSRRRQGRLGGLRILAGQLKPFGADPY